MNDLICWYYWPICQVGVEMKTNLQMKINVLLPFPPHQNEMIYFIKIPQYYNWVSPNPDWPMASHKHISLLHCFTRWKDISDNLKPISMWEFWITMKYIMYLQFIVAYFCLEILWEGCAVQIMIMAWYDIRLACSTGFGFCSA